ncbi:MAG: hypothetical protein PHP70_07545 [Gallionella sp.]|nr:hypothetical protein [Gallionella sp.]
MSETQEAVFEQFNKKISDFKSNIQQYHSALNDEGIWLFLSTLGCWGIPDSRFKFVAFVITLFLFLWRVQERRREKRSFSNVINSLKDEIQSHLQENEVFRDAALHRLDQLSKKQLSLASVTRSALPFVVAWIFFGISFAYLFTW